MKDDDVKRMVEEMTTNRLRERMAPVHTSDISQKPVDETAKREREWVGFTHEELAWLNEALNLGGRLAVIEAIEAKLKEKNA